MRRVILAVFTLVLLAGCAGGGQGEQNGLLSSGEYEGVLSSLLLSNQAVAFSWNEGDSPRIEIEFWKDGTCYTEHYELFAPQEEEPHPGGSTTIHFGLMDAYVTHGHLDADLTQLFITQIYENGDTNTMDVRTFPVSRGEKHATSGFTLDYQPRELNKSGRYLIMQTLFYASDNVSESSPQAAKPEEANCAVVVYIVK